MAQSYEFRGNSHRTLKDLNAWTKQRHEAALEPELPILDPHHHVWDDERGRYLLDELLEDTRTGHNVVATVFIEAGTMYRADGPVAMQPVGEVELVNQLGIDAVFGVLAQPSQ